MKKYTNLIVIGVVLIAGLSYFAIRAINFQDLLVTVGYYDKKVTILNTADIHGHLRYNNVNGEYVTLGETYLEMGLALMKGLIDEERERNPNTLLLDSGDAFHGTPEAAVGQGAGLVEAMNLMGYDAMVPGNHEYNWDWNRAKEIEEEINFPMISANIFKDGEPAYQGHLVFEVDGLKIGVFGLTTKQFLQNMQVYDTTGITYEDPVKHAKEQIALLQEQNVDAIIFLSHLGDDMDKELVLEHGVEGIDFILSGHGHALYEKVEKINDTFIAEAGSYTTHLGVADMYFRNGKVDKVVWSIRQSADTSKEDPEIRAIAERYHALALEEGKRIVGTSPEVLDGLRWNVRTKETNFANLITDAMREVGEADITLFNGGGIRESIDQGEIDLYSISSALPFVNTLVTVELKGEVLYEAIEHGLKTWPYGASNGGFPQVSGISYKIDGSKPAGKRLVSITKDGQPLDRERTYKVAITDYLLSGGDGYDMLKDAKVLYRGELLSDMLAKYIESKEVVNPQIEGRIEVVNQRYADN
ncbi:bifunctional metallophosphatase/5'-nucleotidase [Xylanibacillus composti]|uniref:Metallophosphatase n=1 Tax=Xylanibacillus composti TaxID=1572762 RepID=A0A8J4H8Y6_9BACL|nr:bifunctional UDP-sugar hydrolase/5'-nucleotidase [Xylanibacillus composti]MDT9725898.1 bifunctional metallophosphatase/5'-nucleotidase [Xylanibacillus composti]GIQ71273.1 metallophosphatase [Xylanibacillus composti]